MTSSVNIAEPGSTKVKTAVADVAADKIVPLGEQVAIFENEVKAMEKLVKALPDTEKLENGIDYIPERRDEISIYEGADLAYIRELMDQLAEIDKKEGRPKWAGLTRRQTPEGDIFWLDHEHLQQYLSERVRRQVDSEPTNAGI